ncbi:MAG: hypothetical protein CM15mP58_21420 [Burkholderiaceae bacterium]|nr:MAG: hypothetical protein CM15mP58_21420 [Burkholderiaceae bacterium]
MVFLIVLIFTYTMAQLPEMFGKKKASRTIKSFFSKNKVVNNLALIRIFLFGARDVWFVVALPVFLYSSGWTFIQVSGLMAFWTIFYGFIQAVAPKIIPETESRVIGKRLRNWMFGLCVIPAILYFIVVSEIPLSEAYVILGLFVFALLFAINSSFQSFLIVEYSSKDKTAERYWFLLFCKRYRSFYRDLTIWIFISIGRVFPRIVWVCANVNHRLDSFSAILFGRILIF